MIHPVPAEFLRGRFAPAARTLVDIFNETVEQCPSALALDSGVDVLTYAELAEAADDLAARLAESGVRRGDRVGVRVRSGTTDLYVAILGVLHAGAAYVPVDAEDPDDRARVVFAEAHVRAVIGNDLAIASTTAATRPTATDEADPEPSPEDDAWVIFTSGSTGTPKGVAVSHRNAAAFVDAEARMFLRADPIGPGDRVMAGLSVAFDASCEEMWLAWAYGACLVPAPRSLVRSGADVGPWLVANSITVVSTVPTLVALWPPEALARVRLLIMGGEACPPELSSRLQSPGREVWNTYGPTEATVVACGALLDGSDPVRIGLPLDGWDLAVVDPEGQPVAIGESGELIIGGVGLARYLDAAQDAEKYAAFPTLGWGRAYRSGDIVTNDPAGLVFAGRSDDQIKLGGRRIELGEIDEQLLRLPGVISAAAAVRTTKSGNKLLIGYVTVEPEGTAFDPVAALEILRHRLPAALVPRLAFVEALPTRTSGKVERDALPWPLPKPAADSDLGGVHLWIAEIWHDVLGAEVTSTKDDFFDFGGGSLTAAQVISRLRERYPEIAVGDLYANPTVATLATALDEHGGSLVASDRKVPPIPPKTQIGQVAALLPLRMLAAARWIAWLLLGSVAAELVGLDFWPRIPTAWIVAAALFVLPPVRMLLAAAMARSVLRGVVPGSYPRGGKVHLRLWLAERIQDELAATGVAGAPWFRLYAQLLGGSLGRGTDLHTIPPVTGFITIGDGAAIEPEVDLRGYWIDGDLVRIGAITIGAHARVGARSTLAPGAVLGARAEVAPGSLVLGVIPGDEFWSGSPAERVARHARGPWSDQAPPRNAVWQLVYAVAALTVAALPAAAFLAGSWTLLPRLRGAGSIGDAVAATVPGLPVAAAAGYLTLLLLVLGLVRALGVRMRAGHFPVRSADGVRIWTTMRILDEARTWLFPLYSSALTPIWLRLLGAEIGKGVEASTVLLLPKFTHVNDHAFLADDTLIGCYELGGGWIRVEHVKIGKRAFVGNSGMAAPGRKVPKSALVAVLSAAPQRRAAKAGTSWMGSPPTRLRRSADDADSSRTYDPPRHLRILRGIVELGRIVPVLIGAALHLLVAGALLVLIEVHPLVAAAAGGLVMLAAGLVAALISVAAKWVLVGRHRRSEHPLWSGFVWRNELADTFIEVLAAPWFASVTQGTYALNVWLRLLGATIGRGVWCDTYWLPETDLIELGDGSVVNSGCVVQTHLFHDRVLSMDRVTLQAGATLGPNSVILPAATIGRHATVGPASLVMRGEAVPSRTRWIGNPIGPWDAGPPTTEGEH